MWEDISLFLSAGGSVLWVILFVLIALWFFIIERFYYFYKVCPALKEKFKKRWSERPDKKSRAALKAREAAVYYFKRQISRFVPHIKTLVFISPLLGLTGTVTGMISIFDIISISGTGNPRLMAGGISLAVIPTMAGLVTALSGLYFGNYFERKCEKESQAFAEELETA